jgi:hypothetical protein
MTQTLTEIVCGFPLSDPVFDKLHTAANRQMLCRNEFLTPRQWEQLWSADLAAEDAAWMVSRALTPAQIDRVTAVERRSSVLLSMGRYNDLDEQTLLRMVDRVASSTFAVQVMSFPGATEAVRTAAAAHLTGAPRLQWVAAHTDGVAPDVLAAEILSAAEAMVSTTKKNESSKPELALRHLRTFNDAVTKCLAADPSVLDLLVQPGSVPLALRTILAGSRHLHAAAQHAVLDDFDTVEEFTALAFVANPVADREIVAHFTAESFPYRVRAAAKKRLDDTAPAVSESYETVSDPAVLTKLLRRALPNQYRTDGRTQDLVALAHNPALSDDAAASVAAALETAVPRTVPATHLDSARTHLATRRNETPPPPCAEIGFWSETAPPFQTYQQPPTALHLDPNQRPSPPEAVEAAMAHLAPRSLAVFKEYDLTMAAYESRADLHTFVVAALGDDATRWEMLIALSKTHRGSLEKLLSATRRLVR